MLVPLSTLAESLEHFHKEFQVQLAAAAADDDKNWMMCVSGTSVTMTEH